MKCPKCSNKIPSAKEVIDAGYVCPFCFYNLHAIYFYQDFYEPIVDIADDEARPAESVVAPVMICPNCKETISHDEVRFNGEFIQCPTGCAIHPNEFPWWVGSAVNPGHYASHKVSPIDLISDYGLGFALGNVIKYTARADEKNGREDLLKALWYLLFELGMPKEQIVEITESLEHK